MRSGLERWSEPAGSVWAGRGVDFADWRTRGKLPVSTGARIGSAGASIASAFCVALDARDSTRGVTAPDERATRPKAVACGRRAWSSSVCNQAAKVIPPPTTSSASAMTRLVRVPNTRAGMARFFFANRGPRRVLKFSSATRRHRHTDSKLRARAVHNGALHT